MRLFKYLGVLSMAMAIVMLSACGAGQIGENQTMFFETSRSTPAAAPAAMAPAASSAPAPPMNFDSAELHFRASGEAPDKTPKKVKTGQMDMEVDNTDDALIQLENINLQYGGYVESKSVNANSDDKWAAITLRVPAENYELLVEEIYKLGNVWDFYDSVTDMTGQYYDIKSRLDICLAEESRLLELIERTEKIEDIITLEMRLGDVRVEIAMHESSMREIDRKAGFSTLNINISQKASPRIRDIRKSLPDRMAEAFINSANSIVSFGENLIITITYWSIPLMIILLCTLVGRGVYKRTKK